MSFVSVSDIFQSYGKRPILERVNLEVAEGEFVSIVGASGCGKSTFLRLLLAQERPTRGAISIEGRPPAQEPDRDRGVVFQRYSVFPHMTVRGNLIAAEELGGERAGRLPRFFGARRREAGKRADAALERIGLAHVADQYPASLSGGMQQRLAIAQALAGRPRVLLLDEPFAGIADVDVGAAEPEAYGATITYDFDARDGGIPFQNRPFAETPTAQAQEDDHVPQV